jgi:hypothetical protein
MNVFANGCDGETNGRNDIYSSVDMYSCTNLLGTNNTKSSAAGHAVNIEQGAEVCISDYTVRSPEQGKAEKKVMVTSNINDSISHDRSNETAYVNRHIFSDGFSINKGILKDRLYMEVSAEGKHLKVERKSYMKTKAYAMFGCTKTTIDMNK